MFPFTSLYLTQKCFYLGPRGPYTPHSFGGFGHEGYGRGASHTFPPKPRR